MSLVALVAAAILWFTGHHTLGLLGVLSAVVLFVPRWFSPKTREQSREFREAVKSLQVFEVLSAKELQRLQTAWLNGPQQAGVPARDFAKSVLLDIFHPAARIITSPYVDGPIQPQVETVSLGSGDAAVTVTLTHLGDGYVEHEVQSATPLSQVRVEECATVAREELAKRQFDAGKRPWEPQLLPSDQRDQVYRRFVL